ncbi:hypothetical protein NC799_07280 [Aquibacillus sp. 3ASR75-54]|uniref:Uncharacterized protein n=1 Tax=Aquibacillus salsiterrae TaxID=2950439 RepID=A0A9X3WFX9_9BACI|nr:hypothetical protein [Aquibacillus salsiterrae]MDC3416719.1 hypothetical protein [Aquibacillus salsiterrae]
MRFGQLSKRSTYNENLSLSYIFEDFSSSMYHLNEAKVIAEKLDDKQLLADIEWRNYPFICAVFGHVNGISTEDPAEQAHIEIVKGNDHLARAILNEMTINTPLLKYYYGLATRDKDLLMESCQDFIGKRSDHFFARLPLRAAQGSFC